MLQKDVSGFQQVEDAVQYEWLETNGLGGWSGSSIVGCHTRRYHGLLVAAIVPPAERMSLVSKLDETIISGNERFELGTNNYGSVFHPEGYRYIKNFEKDLFSSFTYVAADIELKKTIAMVHNENTVVICYQVVRSEKPFALEFLPLLSENLPLKDLNSTP